MDTGGELLRKSHYVARCAKASMLLLSLKQSPDRNFLIFESDVSEAQVIQTQSFLNFSVSDQIVLSDIIDSVSIVTDFRKKELMKRTIEVLKASLTIERMERKKVKLYGMAAQIVLLLSVWSFFLVMAVLFY